MPEATNGELAIMLKDLTRETREGFVRVENRAQKIEAQTTKTNGRVSALETWRAMLIGGFILRYRTKQYNQ